MKNNIRKIITVLMIFSLPLFFSCRTNSSAQRQKQVENQREEKDKEAERLYSNAKEKHLKNQTRQTRKQMKSNRGNAEKSGYAKKKPCFIKRWFTKKPKNTCPKS
jgi:type II secretory pathway component PulJ